ncbi:MAG TPA: DUF192 domain-containing protein [Actinomycetota bacterium]|nr:DUF192 domain-containing protein [Actinomycetota bacterium]
MKIRLLVALTLVALGASGCNSYGKEGSAAAPSPSLNPATAMIDTDDGIVLVNTEVADSPEERAVGLMNRESLGEDEGMMFLFFEENRGGFWMKDTLIPLSIAFFDRDGTILSILDMKPCRRDPCKSYDPGVPYWGALEVNQGAYDEWGVEVGDRIRSNQ